MDQHWIKVFLIVKVEHVVDRPRAVWPGFFRGDEVGHHMEISDAQLAAHFLLARGFLVEVAVSYAGVGKLILKVHNRLDAVSLDCFAESVDGELAASVQFARNDFPQPFAMFPNIPVIAVKTACKDKNEKHSHDCASRSPQPLQTRQWHAWSSIWRQARYNACHGVSTQGQTGDIGFGFVQFS
jgi:hypothetical protein